MVPWIFLANNDVSVDILDGILDPRIVPTAMGKNLKETGKNWRQRKIGQISSHVESILFTLRLF